MDKILSSLNPKNIRKQCFCPKKKLVGKVFQLRAVVLFRNGLSGDETEYGVGEVKGFGGTEKETGGRKFEDRRGDQIQTMGMPIPSGGGGGGGF